MFPLSMSKALSIWLKATLHFLFLYLSLQDSYSLKYNILRKQIMIVSDRVIYMIIIREYAKRILKIFE